MYTIKLYEYIKSLLISTFNNISLLWMLVSVLLLAAVVIGFYYKSPRFFIFTIAQATIIEAIMVIHYGYLLTLVGNFLILGYCAKNLEDRGYTQSSITLICGVILQMVVIFIVFSMNAVEIERVVIDLDFVTLSLIFIPIGLYAISIDVDNLKTRISMSILDLFIILTIARYYIADVAVGILVWGTFLFVANWVFISSVVRFVSVKTEVKEVKEIPKKQEERKYREVSFINGYDELEVYREYIDDPLMINSSANFADDGGTFRF